MINTYWRDHTIKSDTTDGITNFTDDSNVPTIACTKKIMDQLFDDFVIHNTQGENDFDKIFTEFSSCNENTLSCSLMLNSFSRTFSNWQDISGIYSDVNDGTIDFERVNDYTDSKKMYSPSDLNLFIQQAFETEFYYSYDTLIEMNAEDKLAEMTKNDNSNIPNISMVKLYVDNCNSNALSNANNKYFDKSNVQGSSNETVYSCKYVDDNYLSLSNIISISPLSTDTLKIYDQNYIDHTLTSNYVHHDNVAYYGIGSTPADTKIATVGYINQTVDSKVVDKISDEFNSPSFNLAANRFFVTDDFKIANTGTYDDNNIVGVGESGGTTNETITGIYTDEGYMKLGDKWAITWNDNCLNVKYLADGASNYTAVFSIDNSEPYSLSL